MEGELGLKGQTNYSRQCTVIDRKEQSELAPDEESLITVITGKLDRCGEARARAGSLRPYGCSTRLDWAELSTATAACPLGGVLQGGETCFSGNGILPFPCPPLTDRFR